MKYSKMVCIILVSMNYILFSPPIETLRQEIITAILKDDLRRAALITAASHYPFLPMPSQEPLQLAELTGAEFPAGVSVLRPVAQHPKRPLPALARLIRSFPLEDLAKMLEKDAINPADVREQATAEQPSRCHSSYVQQKRDEDDDELEAELDLLSEGVTKQSPQAVQEMRSLLRLLKDESLG